MYSPPNRKDARTLTFGLQMVKITKCYGQPAPVTKCIIRPYTACIIHNVIQTAKSCYHTADTGCHILILCYIDTGCIRGIRILHLPHADEVRHVSDSAHKKLPDAIITSQVCQKSIRQEQFSKPAKLSCKRKRLTEIAACCSQAQ